MIFETADDVLEHFGVKGMRWGVRKQRVSSTVNGEQKTSKKKRAAQIAVVAGVVVAGVIIAHKSGVRLSGLNGSSTSVKGKAEATRVLSSVGKQRFSAIPMPPVPTRTPTMPKLRTRTNPGDISALRASIANSVRLANADLRARDNSLNIPIPQRSYIPEWD